jgi:hypothetical protein
MRVVDGIVTGPQHCARPNCSNALASYRSESYCEEHVAELGHLCRVVDCSTPVVEGTRACRLHQSLWRKWKDSNRRSNFLGVSRVIHRPGEHHPWQEAPNHLPNPHDEEDSDPIPGKHYFSPRKYYCVETLCAPCGVVIAWALFSKSESPTNIMKFLTSVYPTPDTRPSFICIDKACIVLKTVTNQPTFQNWLQTTRFIVDSYHYKNHKKTDTLCQKFCNPAPEDGSSPNLVKKERAANGKVVYKRAFNTQVCPKNLCLYL